MTNYTKTSITEGPRTELHEALQLTGAEISINTLPAQANIPFVHAHKQNEEIYGILSGKGKVIIDNDEIALEQESKIGNKKRSGKTQNLRSL